MPERIKALAVILFLALIVFAFSKKALFESASTKQDFALRRNLWFGITISAFLASHFWIFISLSAALLLVGLNREQNRLALFFSLLFVVPQVSGLIPGFGVVTYLFALDIVRLLCLVILLPAFFMLMRRKGTLRFGSVMPDKLIAGYLILQFVLMIQATTTTDAIRKGLFYGFIDAFLPYYVASRHPVTLKQLRDSIAAFTISVVLLATIGIFENSKRWLLYHGLATTLSGSEKWPWTYTTRGGGGLRSIASTGQPIALGYVITIAIAFLLYLREAVSQRWLRRSALALLCGGLLSTISRGPWAGAIAMILTFAACGPTPIRGVLKATLVGGFLFVLALFTPIGDKLMDLIPFVGSVDSQNSEYRKLFVQQSLIVIRQHPWFGSIDFVNAPEMAPLRMNAGLLDTLNIFLTVGLGSGLVGLSLFGGFFVSVGFGIYRAMNSQKGKNGELALLGRALFSALIAIVVIINTISAITIIPIVYWCVAGLGVAYTTLVYRGDEQVKSPLRGRIP